MLRAPNPFFGSLKTGSLQAQRTALVPPTLILFTSAALWFFANTAAQRTLPDLPTTMYGHPAFAFFQVPLAVFVTWVFNSFLLKYLAGLDTRTAWVVAGWIKLPFLLATVGALLLALAFPVQETINPAPADARALSIWLASYWSTVEQSQYSQLTRYLFFGAGLWSLRLLFSALKNLEAKRLYLTVVVFALSTLS